MAAFDTIANTYDSWYTTKMGSFVDMVESELAWRLFNPPKGSRVLDIGCGTGNFSIKLHEAGYKVTGVDISEEMLKIAREKARSKGYDIEFLNMDTYSLDFADETFDAVFSMAAFEFVEDEEKAVSELFRTVRKGGPVLVGTISGDSKWGQLYLTEEFQEKTVFKYAHFKTMEDLLKVKRDHISAYGECLFIPPDSKDNELTLAKEKQFSKTEKGGFICVLWIK